MERGRRLLVALGAAFACAAPFVVSGWWNRNGREMVVVAALLAGVLGAMGRLLWEDLRAGLSTQVAVTRMAVGVAAGAGVLCGVIALLATGVRLTFWSAVDWSVGMWLVGAAVVMALLAGASVSGRYQPGTRSWVVEAVALAVGLPAWLHIARQAAVVAVLVGFGPLAVPMALWGFPYTGLKPGQEVLGTFVIMAIPAVGFLFMRVRRRKGSTAAVFIADALLGLALLGISYRLAAAVALIVLLALDASGRTAAIRRWLQVTVVALCVLPLDVSLQRGASPGPRFLPTMKGDFTSDGWSHGPRYGYVVLDAGSHQTLYFEPTWVWVW